MARDLSSYVSPMIFLEENGAPMEFYIKPGAMKNKIQPLIERGGGMLRSTLLTLQKVIKLADPKEPIEGFVSTDFVFDSVNKQFLQDINKYGLKSKNKSSNRVVKVVNYQDLSDGNDNSVGETRTRRKLYQPRLKYTAADDQAILDYIKKHESVPLQPCGNNLWKRMAAKKVTEHSWQSMRKHYIEFLMKKSALPSKGQLTLRSGSGKRPQSGQESGSARKKSKGSKRRPSAEEDSNDTENDLGNMPSTSRSVSKEQQKATNITVTRRSQKAVESNNDTEEQDGEVGTRVRKKATKSSDTDEHEPLDRRIVIRGKTTRREERATESNTDMDDQPLSQRAAKMRQQKALGSDRTDEQPRGRRTPTRGKEKITESNSDTEDQLLSQRAANRSSGSTDDQPLDQRATTKGRKKATEADDDSEDGTSVELAVSPEGNESEHDTDDQSLSRPILTRSQKDVMDSANLDSHPVPRQVTPVILLNKSKSPDGKLVSKRLLGTRRYLGNRTSTSQGEGSKQNNRLSDVDSHTRVTLRTSQEKGSESESETDDFDKRLLAIAEKASFNLNSRESPNNDNDIGSDDETSAKDTQDDEDDEFIFKRKTLRKRNGKTTKNMNNLNPKEKQTDVDEPGAVRPTTCRSQSATKKSSLAQENSVARVNSTAEVPSSASGANKPSKNKNTTQSPDGCSRRLFEEDNEEESTTMTPRAKGKSRKETTVADKEPDDDAMWHFIEKMVENYLNVQRLQCAKGMTRPQILHSLYVSSGSLKDTENYIKTGKLTNGVSPWSKPENEAILSNEREAVNAIIKKRGQSSVSERRSFLRGCR